MLEDTSAESPLDFLIEKERLANLEQTIKDLLDNDSLSVKQKTQIRMYYFEDKTLSEIGKEFGISREAVRQNIKRGLDLIKAYDKCSS
jgi:RNA polymerase sigma factor (sigma-70 family)